MIQRNMKTAIVLGGTSPHIELVKALKQREYYTILLDYYDDPPAKKYADEHIKESTLDLEKVLLVACEKRADLVISACVDQANSTCCYVAEKLGLPHPYSYETSIQVTVKSEMKMIMAEGEIPTSWFMFGKDEQSIDWKRVVYPAVVKPVDCNSSKGVRRVDTVDEAKLYFNEALRFSRNHCAIIEGYVDGVEIQVDCFATDDGAQVILTRQKKHIPCKENEELNSEGSILPAPICKGLEGQIQDIATKIARSFKLSNTPFFYQAIVDNDGHINVLEFAPRIGGGLSYYILKYIAGFDAIEAVCNSYLGIKTSVSSRPLDSVYSTNLLYMNEGIFDHIDGFSEAQNRGHIIASFVTKEKGVHIDNKLRSGNRVGAFIVKADSIEELKEKEEKAYALIEVFDAEGKTQTRKWRKQ